MTRCHVEGGASAGDIVMRRDSSKAVDLPVTPVPPRNPRRPALRRTLLAICLLAGMLSASSAAADERLVFPGRASPTGPWQLEFVDPVGGGTQSLTTSLSIIDPTWSHDNKTIAFYDQFGRGLVLKPAVGGGESTFIGLDAIRPSWSPVKGEIAYWAPTQTAWQYVLKVAPTDGQAIRTVAGPYDVRFAMPLVGLEQPAWSPDGKKLAFALNRGIVSVPATGGAPAPLVPGGPTRTYVTHEPSYAPDGKQLAYTKSVDDAFGSFTAWELVVRSLQNGQELTVVSGSSVRDDVNDLAHGPQSWSPDSTQVAFALRHGTPQGSQSTVNVVRSDGSGRRSVVQRSGAGAPAWGRPALPSYYVKHVEVSQGISPAFGALLPVDPLATAPLELPWTLPSVAGSEIRLIAGKSTLVRIYVGDASLEPGKTETRELGYRVSYGTPFTPEEGEQHNVTVSAPDVAPEQKSIDSAINVWLPPHGSVAGAPVQISAEVNPDESDAECSDCYPNGNRANVSGVRFNTGGGITLAPVPIVLFGPNKQITLPSPAFASLWGDLPHSLPVRDDGITVDPPGLALPLDATKFPIGSGDFCEYALAELNTLHTLHAAGGPFSATGPVRWVGYGSPAFPPGIACDGNAFSPGEDFVVLRAHQQSVNHEFGHTLGLDHFSGPNALPAAGATALPYSGIGGYGYEPLSGGTVVYDKDTIGDLMSYSPSRWISPFTWKAMYHGILAESPGVTPARHRSGAAASRGLARSSEVKTRRLVTGFMSAGRGVILRSLVAETARNAATGPVFGRVLALDRSGHVLASGAVRGAPSDKTPGAGNELSLPFVITLPASARIAALALRNADGRTLTTVRRSKNAPTGRFKRVPKKLKAGRSLTARWIARDRDRDKLTFALYGRRGKTRWQLIAMGAAGPSRAVVNPSRLGRGKQLRLRLLISDGFRTTTIIGQPIRLAGR